MIWAEPRWLWGAAAAPLLAVFLDLARRRAALAVHRIDPTFQRRRGMRVALPAIAMALLCAALARPEWGFRRVLTASPETDVVILIDTSGSMLARDAAPDRFTRARFFARDLLRRLPENVRSAVVRVEGEGEVICPLTLDRVAAESSLEELLPRGSGVPGSDLGSGVRKALALLGARLSRAKTIVLLSDGEDLDAGLKGAIAECRRSGVVLDTVSVGTVAGAPVPARDGAVLTDGGAPVVSRAHPDDLEALARATGGKFVNLSLPSSGTGSLSRGFEDTAGLGRRTPAREPISRSAWPLSGAIIAWAMWWAPPGGVR
jgi:Ca-activated chloride channel family protein